MKNYELLTIFKPSLDSEELDKVVGTIPEKRSEPAKNNNDLFFIVLSPY